MTITFGAPLFLWLLAALPVVVLLHFLRSRTRRVDVSALFLWQQARQLAERRRRWSPTWSLLAQLLAVAAAAFALAQPDLVREGPADLVIVVDGSASMAAVDPEGSRRDRAVAAALDAAAEAGRVALVRAGHEAVLVLAPTLDRGELREALDAFAPGDVTADLSRGVALARSLAPDARILLVSDDPGPPRSGVVRVDVGGTGENVGIVGFDLGIQQAFVAVASNSRRPRAVGVELRQGESLLASTELFVPARDVATATFPIDVGAGLVEARLLVDATDALALDDVAFAGQRALEVVVDEAFEPIVRAFSAVRGTAPRVTGGARTVPADVRVLTGADPDALPAGDAVVLPRRVEEPEFVTIASWDRTHPLLRFVDLREFVVGLPPVGRDTDTAVLARRGDAAASMAPGSDAAAFGAGDGWQTLASTADLRPVLRYREDGERRILEFLFHPSQSDIVLRPAFPTLVANLVERFRGEARVPLGVRDDAGRLVTGPGPAIVDGREVVANLLTLEQTRLPGPGDDDLAVVEPALPAVRPTPLAAALVALALALLVAEWFLWSRGAGARGPRRRPRRARTA
jgi:hypothetical protein